MSAPAGRALPRIAVVGAGAMGGLHARVVATSPRAELDARALGKRVGRILSISEAGANYAPPVVMMRQAARGAMADSTSVDPGEQTVAVSLSVSFELE